MNHILDKHEERPLNNFILLSQKCNNMSIKEITNLLCKMKIFYVVKSIKYKSKEYTILLENFFNKILNNINNEEWINIRTILILDPMIQQIGLYTYQLFFTNIKKIKKTWNCTNVNKSVLNSGIGCHYSDDKQLIEFAKCIKKIF